MKRFGTAGYVILPALSLVIVFGGWLMATTCRDIVLGMVAEGWAQTTGRLVEFTDETSNSTDGGYSWVAHVRYAYTVEGLTYEGSTIHPTYGSPPSNRMDCRLVSLLESAREIRVFYDKSNPGRSTLSAGFYSSSLAVFFAGLVFLAVGLGISSVVLMACSSSTGNTIRRIPVYSFYAVIIGFVLTIGFLVAGGSDFASGVKVIR